MYTQLDVYVSMFYCYHWIDTSAGGLLASEGIIGPDDDVSHFLLDQLRKWNKT